MYDECSQTYTYYEPSPVVWTDFFEVPSTELYYYEASTETY
jgi:hypothetical protein